LERDAALARLDALTTERETDLEEPASTARHEEVAGELSARLDSLQSGETALQSRIAGLQNETVAQDRRSAALSELQVRLSLSFLCLP
jgi:hypothetical protein